MEIDMWGFRGGATADDLHGFAVHAPDGQVGAVHAASLADGWIVVATDGPDGRQVLLPAGITDAIDADARIVRVASAAELVRGGPEYEAGVGEEYRGRVATYYAGHRPG